MLSKLFDNVDIVGTMGFVVATMSAAWSIYSETIRSREKVLADAVFSSRMGHFYGTIEITVVNHGRVPVYIREVGIYWEYRDPEPKENQATNSVVTQVSGSIVLGHKDQLAPLQPGQARPYVLTDDFAPICKQAILAGEDLTWIGVTSPKGELCRLEGPEIFSIITSIANTVETQGLMPQKSHSLFQAVKPDAPDSASAADTA